MKRARAKRNRSAPFESFDEAARADEKVLDHLLVVFHRRALRDRQCNDTRAAKRETVHSQHSIRYAGQESRILRYRVLLSHDSRGKFWDSLPQTDQLGLAALGRDIIRHKGAEWINVHPAIRLDRHVKFTHADSSAGEDRGKLPKREIFFERYCVELMKYRRHFVIRALSGESTRSDFCRRYAASCFFYCDVAGILTWGAVATFFTCAFAPSSLDSGRVSFRCGPGAAAPDVRPSHHSAIPPSRPSSLLTA